MQIPRNLGRAALLTVAFLCTLAASAQVPGSSPTYSVSGTVVSSAGGEPIPHALVQIIGQQQRAAMTDETGSFRFDGVAPGPATFMANKPGFFPPQSTGTPMPRSTMFTVGPDMQPITLKLLPEAILFGKIENARGEPVEGANVRLLMNRIVRGRKMTQPRIGIRTDEDGNYRVASLTPGTYYISVGGGRDMPNPVAQQGPEQGYPVVVFYPGVTDFSAATPMQLAAGQQTEVNFTLKSTPVYRVSGKITGIPPESGAGVQFGTGPPGEARLETRFDPRSGDFTTMRVPAGRYIVTANSQDRMGGSYFAQAPVEVTGDIADLTLALAPDLSISVLERDDFSQPVTYGNGQRLSVQLQSSDGRMTGTNFNPRNSADPTNLQINRVRPGTYAVIVTPHGPWYASSAISGRTDLLREPLTVAPGVNPQPIEVVLRDDGGSVGGTVNLTDDSDSAHVLLYSNSSPMWQPKEMNMIGTRSRFMFSNLPPGDYTLIAIDQVDDLEYQNPAAMQDYISKGTRITVDPRSSQQFTLQPIRRSQ